MANSATPTAELIDDAQIWDSLKLAIASSSGFQRWQLERGLDDTDDITLRGGLDDTEESSLDHRVRRYLRDTLETLAY